MTSEAPAAAGTARGRGTGRSELPMHVHGIPPRQWIGSRRRELAAGTALAVVATAMMAVGPLLLALAVVEWKYSHRRRRLLALAMLAALARAALWLWRDLRGAPHGRWHPCASCGGPIEAPSRARYCSPGCRRRARLESDARAFDPWIAERARTRLDALAQTSPANPELSEIPF
jgi:hypothetical protein